MRWMESALVTVMLVISGCAGSGVPQSPGAATPAPTPSPEPQFPVARADGELTLSTAKLVNASYPLPEANGNLIKFTDGFFKGPVVPGSSDEVRFLILDRIARGDLDGDGVDDAAFVMIKDPTGDKPMYTLWAVINQNGLPDPRGYILLGEGIQVGAISIEDLKIYVDVVRPGLEDIQGVPTRRIKESYKLLGTSLERADTFR